VRQVLKEAKKIGTVESIFFEGGEPLLFYPSLLEEIKDARKMGFKVGIVTNAYGAISAEDAELWLRPLARMGLSNLSISDDAFHYEETENSPAKIALRTAQKLRIPCSSICIDKPTVESPSGSGSDKGKPVIGGGALFKGRAVEKLTEGLPTRPSDDLTECPHEDLVSPSRVHVDSYGHVHVCQGISIGNMWEVPLSVLLKEYRADSHPICGPLVKGGPASLARQYGVEHEAGYVDECHFCYVVRRCLIDRFPRHLAPKQVYGIG
jgi:hypothetical protein